MTPPVDPHPVIGLPLASLFRRRRAQTRRASSYDRSGGNDDYLVIGPGEIVTLLEHDGPGCVTHVYCAMMLPDLRDHRNAILRCYWDGSDRPAVEVPLGDFFGLAHGRIREVSSRLTAVGAGYGGSHGLSAYFPMPFASARVTLENRGQAVLGGAFGAFWYHVEYETYAVPPPEEVQRFHASYRQERPTVPVGDQPNETLHAALNTTGADNYVVLDTEGEGRMVGLLLEIDNLQGPRWYGEGDDMVFVDGEAWPPSIHGTGTEEIFGGGASPATEYAGLFSGYHLVESPSYDGLVGMFRWLVDDPIEFSRSLRWTIEHGHANNFSNDYASVAYWYQTPQAELPPLPAAGEMLPPLDEPHEEARTRLFSIATAGDGGDHEAALRRFLATGSAADAFYRGDFAEALERLARYEAGEA